MLAYQWQTEQQSGIPVVFLHGLLGTQHDWVAVFALLQNMSDLRPLAIDLPYHNQSATIECRDFADCRAALHHTLQQAVGDQPFYLVGYSLGGRLALDYALNQPNPFLHSVILEGANIGLASEVEKAARWQHDQRWATRFESEPIIQVLNDWYQQPVFADLTADKRAEFIRKRQQNDGNKIAAMLRATSLAKQPLFKRSAHSAFSKEAIFFLIGEHDHKFRQMAERHQLPYKLISNAGHNAHQANPPAFTRELLNIIRR